MEDALVLAFESVSHGKLKVLILVLMEDALVHRAKCPYYVVDERSLNPCFNGRCTRT